ncbi:WD40 repeat-like protein [Obba rivulosa]|uniref:WD40 repeat-like protein n=1 Tax=Obba rivulosa TaxID=1052685 RepID=A0A8E2DLM2_9APHY|nr:WD40 repeat-like protein [Obba rivulosa]
MRVRTLEIRWHDSKPISTCDFQPAPFKKARPAQEKGFAAQSYRFATGGEDNHVRLWMVHPNILPQSVVENASDTPAPRPPRVEYLATLSRHSAAVNVVRFSPNGELIASAGDDGMIIIWSQTNNPHGTSYGSDLSQEELQYEKEHWKPRTTFRCTTMQVYDLAWSPTGEYIIAGSTDNCARIFLASEGKCIHEIAEHNHYVQGVAWDPLNEYIATQSSDRSMHVYSISYKQGVLDVHAIGKNVRLTHRHSRTPSTHGRPRPLRRESAASETESVITSASEQLREREDSVVSSQNNALLTPTASVPSTPSGSMYPPPSFEMPSSRRSSFSGSNAAPSPATYARYGRSPSPMPALPAIRMNPTPSWASVKLYGEEGYTNFFRRLTFSPDGGLLLTPAGQFEDPSIIPGTSTSKSSNGKTDDQPTRGRKPTISAETSQASTSSVYIYSRANFARPPVARLPGHKKASVAVRFSPILYELRPGVSGADTPAEPPTVLVEKGREESLNVNIGSMSAGASGNQQPNPSPISPQKPPHVVAPSPRIAIPSNPAMAASTMMPSPALSASESLRPPTPTKSKSGSSSPAPPLTASVFALPYRMLYAVATMDTVTIYDTQQAGPVCLLTKLHYDEFTDMTWSPDGQCLMMSSRDGYCTIAVFDEILPVHHTQQHMLQLQSIAHHHSVPLTNTSTTVTPLSTPAVTSAALPALSAAVPSKRKAEAEAPLTPALSVDESVLCTSSTTFVPKDASPEENKEPPKKKRRAALTHVGVIGS